MESRPPHDILELTRGASTLRFAPWAGGRLLSWQVGGEPVIRWPDNANWDQPARVRGGNPLLFPFLGRHFVDGQIGRWRDTQGVEHELPTHGFARDLPFSADVDADGHGVRMTLADSPATRAGYPYAFRFEALYRLAGDHALDVTLTATNTGDVPLPWYAGHHFYFELPHTQRAQSTVEMPPAQRRHQLPDGSISAPEAGETHYRLDDAGIIDRFHVLERTPPATPVRLVTPGLKRAVTIDLDRPDSLPWFAVTTWTEAADSDFYCVEPWLGLPDAIHNGQGLRWLAPGASESATLQLRVESLG
ncbi:MULTISPECIES: aldose epimerase [unclassified Paraburkholderia]|uniref:aldose epimerase family protein n=1 Tax=unclassified Paraburkholderia TaxID=2615204 RepID=UPI00197DACE5|nr:MULTISPECIES: aldose epimerase [unclassified Paraburkholderia]MBN3856068.1 aldose epimerase [Paraburkholderia sp. Ac-20340]